MKSYEVSSFYINIVHRFLLCFSSKLLNMEGHVSGGFRGLMFFLPGSDKRAALSCFLP